MTAAFIDLDRLELRAPGRSTDTLTPAEGILLSYLASQDVGTREELRAALWGPTASDRSRALHHAITRLRKKLEPDPSSPVYLLTVRGRGYRLQCRPEGAPPLQLGRATPAASIPTFGRDVDLVRLETAMRPGRVVVLQGTGGVGKTHLATEWARTRPRVVWVSLAAARSVDDLREGLASTLEVPVRALGAALRHRQDTTLILDNVEQLDDAALEVVAELASDVPHVSWLLTSRRAMPFEAHTVPLSPLDPESAVALYGACGRGETPASETALRQLVLALDGLPLAIKLAAARSALMSPQQVLRRLATLRDSGESDPRHHSLEATFRWSWQLLSEDERELLAQCTVFSAPFDLEDLEAVVVLPGGSDLVDAVEALVRHSLISARGGELSLLETLRANSRAYLEHPDPVRRRHAEYFVARGEALLLQRFGGQAEPARQGLIRIRQHLLDAARYARQLGDLDLACRAVACLEPVHVFQSTPAHRVALWESVLQGGRLSDFQRNRCHRMWANALRAAGRHHEALEVLRAIGEVGPPDNPALRHLGLAAVHMELGQFDRARNESAASLRAAAQLRSPFVTYMVRTAAGTLAWLTGNNDEAREHYRTALVTARSVGDTAKEGLALVYLGNVALQLGELEEARTRFDAAVQVASTTGSPGFVASALGNLGALLIESGDLARAIEHLEDSVRRAGPLGEDHVQAISLGALAVARFLVGRTAEALDAIALAVQLEERGRALPDLIAWQGVLLAAAGSGEPAERALDRAEQDAPEPRRQLVMVGRALVAYHGGSATLAHSLLNDPGGQGTSQDLRLARLVLGHVLG